jgi:transcriptional regulator with XRE-family HTH domain
VDLSRWLEIAGLSQREVARRVGYTTNGPLSKIIKGTAYVPPDDIPKWADALGLSGAQRAQFIEECKADSLPAWHLAEIAELRAQATNSESICLRLLAARQYAEQQGVLLDFPAWATSWNRAHSDTSMDTFTLMRAATTGHGSPAALDCVAAHLGVAVDWILQGVNDPPWYIAWLGSLIPANDPVWQAEYDRTKSMRKQS